MNRDIPTLQNVVYLKEEVVRLENRMAFERDRMTNITQHLSFTAGCGGEPYTLDSAFASLEQLEKRHREKARMYARAMRHADRIMDSIMSLSMRTFVDLMYVEQLDKQDVMERLHMTEWEYRKRREAVEKADCMESVAWKDRKDEKE